MFRSQVNGIMMGIEEIAKVKIENIFGRMMLVTNKCYAHSNSEGGVRVKYRGSSRSSGTSTEVKREHIRQDDAGDQQVLRQLRLPVGVKGLISVKRNVPNIVAKFEMAAQVYFVRSQPESFSIFCTPTCRC
jgi:hypothetical protein